MPRNGSGTASVVNTFVDGTTITAAAHNTNWTDAASEITNSLALDGQSQMTGQLKIASGTVGAPGLVPGSDLDTGIYRIGGDNLGVACAGAKVLDIGTSGLSVTGSVASSAGILSTPIGMVVAFAGTSAPSLWLLCYGQAISRSTYAELFGVLGTTYGVGDGSTTFNLPDCRGRVTAGKDDMGGSSANRLTNQSGGLNGDTLGATGGSEVHELTQAQLPNVMLEGTTSEDGAHTHTAAAVDNGGGPTNAFANAAGNLRVATITTSSDGAHDHDVEVALGGSGTPHNNVQPTLILNMIIFAGV